MTPRHRASCLEVYGSATHLNVNICVRGGLVDGGITRSSFFIKFSFKSREEVDRQSPVL